ncbi:MAG TPA: TIM-barrel domain-containing protein, partial [Symbiobacteriaceae bacterium]|nr:TIM-barrel domain-containing protein [Symbiobacteriaceae bacterium]
MHLIDTILGWTFVDGRLRIRTAAGALALTALAPDLIRLELDATGGTLVLPTGAVIKNDWAPVAAEAGEALDGSVMLTAGRLRAVVSPNPLRIDWYDGERLFARDESFHVGDGRILVTRSLPDGERCYGFGEKTGWLDKRGRKLTMWATDQGVQIMTDPLYQSIPFYIGLRDGQAHGLFVDATARSIWDMGSHDPTEKATVEVYSLRYEAYVFAGPAMAGVVSRYTELTGRAPLPPLWSLGYHQCRYSYYPEARVRELAATFRERDIPCDAIWLDIDYMDGYRVFTWDKERFPDPAAMTADLAAQGFKTVVIVDPGVKVDEQFAAYREGVAGKYFCMNPDGTPYVGKVWPGPSVYPDFMQAAVRRWWGDRHGAAYLDQGIAGIWNDMNEPANSNRNEQNEKTLPHYVLQGEEGRKVPHAQVHNAYGFRMAQATYEGLQRFRPERRPFILTRSGYAGIQRYAAVW